MGKVAATEFKAKCLELMDRVAERSESFVITKRGKQVARLFPVKIEAPESLLGALRGLAWETGDIVSPVLPSSAWEAQREGEPSVPEAPRRPPRRTTSRRRR